MFNMNLYDKCSSQNKERNIAGAFFEMAVKCYPVRGEVARIVEPKSDLPEISKQGLNCDS